MKIAIYGRCYNPSYHAETQLLLNELLNYEAELYIYEPFFLYINGLSDKISGCRLFNTIEEFDPTVDYMLSIGGDGTFLEAAKFVLYHNIPILGINFGRLGFLAQVSNHDIIKALGDLFIKKYTIEQRYLLTASGSFIAPDSFPHALNEISIQRNTPVMIKTTVNINNELLSSYWSDGLLVSTPTGSTAYSLSVGGPVVLPTSQNFLITPIAPHNLNIRPIVISADSVIEIMVVTRKGKVNVSIDNQMFEIESGSNILIKKSDFTLNFIKLSNTSFFKTLQDKLHWGFDPRN